VFILRIVVSAIHVQKLEAIHQWCISLLGGRIFLAS
jgi:hypothetical protein